MSDEERRHHVERLAMTLWDSQTRDGEAYREVVLEVVHACIWFNEGLVRGHITNPEMIGRPALKANDE